VGTVIGSSVSHVVLRIKKRDLQLECLCFNRTSKEDLVKLHLKQWALNGIIPRYTSHDKRFAGCKTRPDFVWYTPTHAVLVEVDEFQHSNKYYPSSTYKPHDEFQRMVDMSSAFGKPLTIIRYNPDAFKISGETFRISKIDRMPLLLERIRLALSTPPLVGICVEYLFYSRIQPLVETPFIGQLSFPDHHCMRNWIDGIGAGWETLTLSEAVEIAGTGIPCVLPQKQETIFGSGTVLDSTPYQNLELLQHNGCCFEESLAFMLKEDIRHSAINAMQITSRLVHMVTGELDPFKLTQKIHSELDIKERLQCSFLPYTTKKRTKDEYCLSQAKKQDFITLYDLWHECNPKLYQIRDIPREGPLKIGRAIHIMDKMLEIMFDMRFTMRTNIRRLIIDGVQRTIHLYVARESTKFKMSWKVDTASPASASKVASLSAIQESLQACQNEHFVPS